MRISEQLLLKKVKRSILFQVDELMLSIRNKNYNTIGVKKDWKVKFNPITRNISKPVGCWLKCCQTAESKIIAKVFFLN